MLVNSFVSMRNQILNEMKSFEDNWNREEKISKYTKDDFISVNNMAMRFKSTKHTNLFNLWSIPKKLHNNEIYEDNEMTEDEESKMTDVDLNSLSIL